MFPGELRPTAVFGDSPVALYATEHNPCAVSGRKTFLPPRAPPPGVRPLVTEGCEPDEGDDEDALLASAEKKLMAELVPPTEQARIARVHGRRGRADGPCFCCARILACTRAARVHPRSIS